MWQSVRIESSFSQRCGCWQRRGHVFEMGRSKCASYLCTRQRVNLHVKSICVDSNVNKDFLFGPSKLLESKTMLKSQQRQGVYKILTLIWWWIQRTRSIKSAEDSLYVKCCCLCKMTCPCGQMTFIVASSKRIVCDPSDAINISLTGISYLMVYTQSRLFFILS